MLKSHVVLRLETNTSTKDVSQGSALLSKRVDDWGAGRCQGGLEHVAKNTEHAMKVLEVFGGRTTGRLCFPLNTSHQLRDHNQINDQGGCKQRVLADVEETVNCQHVYEDEDGRETYEMV